MEQFGALNWTIVLVYVAANLVLGYVLGKRVDTADDYYLGRRTTPWWAIGVSVMATYVSALSFLGAPAWAYTGGMSVLAIHINYPLVIFLVITLFLPFFYNSGVASIYDYQERRFGRRARAVMSLIFLISQTLTSAAILYATALVLSFITGVDVIPAIIIVTVVALIYTIMGGITAVIWTDVIQAAILLIGAVIIFAALSDQLPQSLHATLVELKSQGRLNPLDFSWDFTLEATVWSGVIAMTLYHVTVYGANQMVVQRALAAKNIGDAKKSFLFMGFAAFFIYFLFMLLGVLFYSYYQGRSFDNDNTIILQFAADYGLPGLMGILAAAVMAASMSSLDSALNSLATVSTVDFYQKYFRRDGSSAHYLKASRVFTVIWAGLIITPAIMFAQTEGSILQILTKVGSYFVGAKLSMYALGFFSRHTTERGLLIGVAAGFVMVWFVATRTDIAWPWFCLLGAIVNVVVAISASLLLDGRQAEWSPYTIRGQIRDFAQQGKPEKHGGWYLVPGRVDRITYLLPAFFVATFLFLLGFQWLI